jgi:hypothetical protein
MKTVCLAIALLVLASSASGAQELAPKTTTDNCTPQPDCRLAFTRLKPGAPTGTGLKASENHTAQYPSQQTSRPRSSFRIPKSPE